MFERHLVRVWIGIMFLSCMFLMGQEDWGQGLKQPTQEGAGPGDNTYICDPETGVFFDHNEAWIDDYLGSPLGGYIYAPACAERPQEAPVVFFFHMAAADLQKYYVRFHRHMAAKGYIVIAPNYHRPPVSGDVLGIFSQIPIDWVKAGIRGAKAGYEYYESHIVGPENVPTPMSDQGGLVYGVAGHSIGGVIGTAFANPTIRNSVPGAETFDWNPKAVVMMNSGQSGDLSLRCPGWVAQIYCMKSPLAFFAHTFLNIDNHYRDPDWRYDPERCSFGEYVGGQHCMVTDGSFMAGDLSEITYNPLWIVMVGEADWEIGETPALQAYCKATNTTDRHYLRVRSDSRGQPHLKAKHTGAMGDDLLSPIWTDQVDAHDYYAYWKIVTAAMNCAIHGQDCNYARGGTNEQLSMGNWSDGTPVEWMEYNPRVRDNDGNCYDLEDACEMVNDIDPVTQESAWNWRGPGIPADCDN